MSQLDITRTHVRGLIRWGAAASALLALILVPFALFEERVNALSAGLVTPERSPAAAALAVGLLLASDVVLPVPSSILSTASGALFGWLFGALVSWLGMTAGCVAAWGLGRWAGRTGLRRLVGEAELERATRLASRHGAKALVLARPVPVLAEASVLLAAACGMPLPKLVALCAMANAGVSLAYAGVGALAADVSSFLLAFCGSIAIPAVATIFAMWHRHSKTL
jgi:uncharacterized membrane protein YdjX (TVP38/TMEM64 family)